MEFGATASYRRSPVKETSKKTSATKETQDNKQKVVYDGEEINTILQNETIQQEKEQQENENSSSSPVYQSKERRRPATTGQTKRKSISRHSSPLQTNKATERTERTNKEMSATVPAQSAQPIQSAQSVHNQMQSSSFTKPPLSPPRSAPGVKRRATSPSRRTRNENGSLILQENTTPIHSPSNSPSNSPSHSSARNKRNARNAHSDDDADDEEEEEEPQRTAVQSNVVDHFPSAPLTRSQHEHAAPGALDGGSSFLSAGSDELAAWDENVNELSMLSLSKQRSSLNPLQQQRSNASNSLTGTLGTNSGFSTDFSDIVTSADGSTVKLSQIMQSSLNKDGGVNALHSNSLNRSMKLEVYDRLRLEATARKEGKVF